MASFHLVSEYSTMHDNFEFIQFRRPTEGSSPNDDTRRARRHAAKAGKRKSLGRYNADNNARLSAVQSTSLPEPVLRRSTLPTCFGTLRVEGVSFDPRGQEAKILHHCPSHHSLCAFMGGQLITHRPEDTSSLHYDLC